MERADVRYKLDVTGPEYDAIVAGLRALQRCLDGIGFKMRRYIFENEQRTRLAKEAESESSAREMLPLCVHPAPLPHLCTWTLVHSEPVDETPPER